MKILAIETSCDETAAALVEGSGSLDNPEIKILAKKVHSQIEDHREYGGVYPTVAKREHTKNIAPVVAEVLKDERGEPKEILKQVQEDVATILEKNQDLIKPVLDFLKKTPRPDIDLIAVTSGPGLEPALWVGINFAKVLSLAWNIPLMPVNHMEGHMASVLLKQNSEPRIEFPALSLLISGGHTEIVEIGEWNKYRILGKTKDDAVGESYDKVARMLGFPYPGGPKISELARKFRESRIQDPESKRIKFPRPMIDSDNLDFSFSGLKTAVLYKIKELGELTDKLKIVVAGEFEEAVADTLCTKVKKALLNTDARSLVVAGGVVANQYLRERLETITKEADTSIHFPAIEDCTDNAQMIGAAAYIKSHTQKPAIKPEIVASSNLTYVE